MVPYLQPDTINQTKYWTKFENWQEFKSSAVRGFCRWRLNEYFSRKICLGHVGQLWPYFIENIKKRKKMCHVKRTLDANRRKDTLRDKQTSLITDYTDYTYSGSRAKIAIFLPDIYIISWYFPWLPTAKIYLFLSPYKIHIQTLHAITLIVGKSRWVDLALKFSYFN